MSSDLVDWAQQAILQHHDEASYYRTAYALQEESYWSHIPGWMAQDWPTRPHLVVDVGSAYGTLAMCARRLWPDASVVCMDVGDGYLPPGLREQHRLGFLRADIEAPGWESPSGFDIVIFTEILEHMNRSPLVALGRLRRMLAPEGLIYLSTPDAAQWGRLAEYASWRDIPEDAPAVRRDEHIYQYEAGELLDLVEEAGLIVLRWDFSPGVGERRHHNLTLGARL